MGWGCATASYPTNAAPAAARVRLSPEGHVQAAAYDVGTGTYTVVAQMAANRLGVAVWGDFYSGGVQAYAVVIPFSSSEVDVVILHAAVLATAALQNRRPRHASVQGLSQRRRAA